jgi:hypothetical protein
MNQIDFKAVNEQIEALENKRVKFRIIGICCGVTAIFPIILLPLGGLFPIAWIACLTSGFVCRSVAVKARNEAMRLRLSISNLPGSPVTSENIAAKAGAPRKDPISSTLPTWAPESLKDSSPAAAEASKPAAQKPAAPSAKPRNTASRLDKARRREE